MNLVAAVVFLGGATLAADVASATEVPDAEPAGACLAFGAPCSAGDKCCGTDVGWGVCHKFGRGSRCTVACPSDPTDCPNEGRGCNGSTPSVCRVTKKGKGNKDKSDR